MDESTEMDARAEETGQVVQPRAYQLELFEKSMRENVIVTVGLIHRVIPG
jgi:ERCC4-related helicase